MSKLVIRSRGLGQEFQLNCTQFSAPIASTISSAQTRQMRRHFPIKVNQPEVEFVVVFPNENEYDRFQGLVRRSQVNAVNTGQPLLTLWWPERDILNWTGVIKEFRAGGQRANYMPVARFTVSLVDSMVAKETGISSIAAPWTTIIGAGMVDSILGLPSLVLDLLDSQRYGSTMAQISQTNAAFTNQSPVNNILSGNLGIPGPGG